MLPWPNPATLDLTWCAGPPDPKQDVRVIEASHQGLPPREPKPRRSPVPAVGRGGFPTMPAMPRHPQHSAVRSQTAATTYPNAPPHLVLRLIMPGRETAERLTGHLQATRNGRVHTIPGS